MEPMLSHLLYDYQTLVAGCLAVVAALVGALALQNQTNNQRRIAEAATRRNTKAAIATLIAEVHAMKQHSVKAKTELLPLLKPVGKRHPNMCVNFMLISRRSLNIIIVMLSSLFVLRQKFAVL
jgi:hypothetical protein